jgi:cell division protein FtsB
MQGLAHDERVRRTRTRSRRRPRSLRPVVAAGVLGLGLVCAAAFTGVTTQEHALARSITALQSDIAAEQARNTQLQASAAEKLTPEYVSEKAKQLGFVKPGEALIAVERDSKSPDGARDASGQPSRIAKWVVLFFGGR